MKHKAVLCFGLLCIMLCSGACAGLCATAPRGPFSLDEAVDGAYFAQVIQDDAATEEFRRMLESIAYTSISDGKTVTFPFDDGSNALCYRTLDLDTLQQSDALLLRKFGEGETLLKVLPRMGGFDALTDRALYRYDGMLKLIQTIPLPGALIGMEGLQEKLTLSAEVNQDGTLLLFEAEGEGIFLCALQPDAEPSLLFPGTTFADANGNALEGYREGRFLGLDRVSAYLWDKEGRIAYELFDLDGHRLYQSFVFNQRTDSETGTRESRSEIRQHEAEGIDGIVFWDPTSLNAMSDPFFYFDYHTLQLNRVIPEAFGEPTLRFFALDGSICIFAQEDWRFNRVQQADVRFFSEDFATAEARELPFVLHDVAEFTAALAPGGRILFVCRDYTSGVLFQGVFRMP